MDINDVIWKVEWNQDVDCEDEDYVESEACFVYYSQKDIAIEKLESLLSDDKVSDAVVRGYIVGKIITD